MFRDPCRLLAVAVFAAIVAVPSARASQTCPADCNGDRRVSIDELLLSVNIALAYQPPARCPVSDSNGDGRVSVDELVRAVEISASGCPADATVTPIQSATATPTSNATSMATASATPRPNFLLIDLDDVRADGIDRMTTVLTRLAAEGISFRNSFVSMPLCAPSRASILTGLYAEHHGTQRLAGPMGGAPSFRASGADQQTVAVWLRDAGYATGFFGKYLNAYSEEQDPDTGTFYVPPGWSRWRAFAVEHYGGRDGVDYALVDDTGAPTPYQDHATDAQYSTDVIAGEVRSFIADAVASGTPFFAAWTPYAAHVDAPTLLPVPAARHLNTLAHFPPWRPPSWDEEDRTDKPRWVQALDPNLRDLVFTDLARQRAYETLLSVDEQVGLLLDQLRDLGIADHTVVLLTSDNGVGWGEHALDGGWRKDCPYEECLRVPLLVRYPLAAAEAPRELDGPVLNIDVPVTIADIAGVPIPVGVDGVSLRNILEGGNTPLRSDFLIEHWGDFAVRLAFSAQPFDGDRIRVFFGAWPEQSLAFEFDRDGQTAPGSIPVPIQADAAATFAGLGTQLSAYLTNTSSGVFGRLLSVVESSAAPLGVYWLDEVNQGGAFTIAYPPTEFFGVRDVLDRLTYAEHESGEVELYDLRVDPWQLDNKADDPTYAATRARLAARTRELVGSPRGSAP